ncbi:MAG: cytochrome C oxidase subunit II [Deltaproteobacteria bacterium]|nr:cytochrome C oxidase subunit II [Deltaproteobacteria bacterium]
MLERFALQASTFAASIDQVILVVAIIVGFWFFLAEGVLFWLLAKFRYVEGRKGQYVVGESKEDTKWISRAHKAVLVCDVVILAFAIKVWIDVKIDLPPADQTVRIVGQQWAWTFVHPGLDGKLDTPDDIKTADELHVELGKNVHFLLTATDVLHSFSVPAFRLKQDAIPGRVITGWFNATKTGTFDIQCAEICGIGHGIMAARIVVDSANNHQDWVKANAPLVVASAATTVEPTPTETATTAHAPEGTEK